MECKKFGDTFPGGRRMWFLFLFFFFFLTHGPFHQSNSETQTKHFSVWRGAVWAVTCPLSATTHGNSFVTPKAINDSLKDNPCVRSGSFIHASRVTFPFPPFFFPFLSPSSHHDPWLNNNADKDLINLRTDRRANRIWANYVAALIDFLKEKHPLVIFFVKT